MTIPLLLVYELSGGPILVLLINAVLKKHDKRTRYRRNKRIVVQLNKRIIVRHKKRTTDHGNSI